jgi:hypothetical protein
MIITLNNVTASKLYPCCRHQQIKNYLVKIRKQYIKDKVIILTYLSLLVYVQICMVTYNTVSIFFTGLNKEKLTRVNYA